MKLNISLLPELIYCVESLDIICTSKSADLNSKKNAISKYHKHILKLTEDIKETFNIVMICILGDGYKVISKLKTKFSEVIK